MPRWVAGDGITLTHDTGAKTLTIAVDTAAAGLAELIRDTIGAALVEGSGIDVTVDDAGNTITLAVTVAGGLTDPTTTEGDLLVRDASAVDRLGVGAESDVLTVVSGVPAWAAPAGGGGSSDPTLYAKREMQILKNPGAGTSIAVGTAAWTLSATASNADDADGPWVNHATGTTSGNASGALSGTGLVRRDWQPEFIARIKTPSDITSMRLWIGFATGNPDGSDAPSSHMAAFRFSTGVPDTNWIAYTDDGDGTGTATDTGVAVAADTVYLLRVDCSDPANVKFYVNGSLVATNTTNLPTATTGLFAQLRVTTLTAASRALKWGRVAILHV
jgi:hypothetical protein